METEGALTFTEAVGSVSVPREPGVQVCRPRDRRRQQRSGRPAQKHLRVGGGATEVGNGGM